MNMKSHPWPAGFPGGITVCDREGIVQFMNERAIETFKQDLTGKSLLDCHPGPARAKLLELLEKPQTNAYTIEKKGLKKLIYQAPWFEGEEFKGVVELSLVVPAEMPHFVRS